MNKFAIAALISAPLFSLNVSANDTIESKPWNIGIGSYASSVNVDSTRGDEDIDFSGFNLTGSYAFSDNVAIRASYFSLDNDDFSALESTGFDVVAYYGTGLATTGFKAYIGGGLFSDSWSRERFSEDFSGLQINGGFGYSWEPVALDLVIGIRSASDYADLIGELGGSGEVVAISASLMVSARF